MFGGNAMKVMSTKQVPLPAGLEEAALTVMGKSRLLEKTICKAHIQKSH